MIERAVEGMVWLLTLAIPMSILGVWKLVDIVIWLIKNVSITIGT